MSEFLFLFRGSSRQARSPEEMQKSMQKWVVWFKQLNERTPVSRNAASAPCQPQP